MRKFLYSSLILLAATIATPTFAAEVTPQNLVWQGYQGRLAGEGIPGYASFRQAVFLGKVDAKTLVESAIAQGKLNSRMANDESYLSEVDNALFLLRVNGSSR